MGFLRRDKRTLNERLLDNLHEEPEAHAEPEPQPVEDEGSSWEPSSYWDVVVEAEDAELREDSYEFASLASGDLVVEENVEESLVGARRRGRSRARAALPRRRRAAGARVVVGVGAANRGRAARRDGRDGAARQRRRRAPAQVAEPAQARQLRRRRTSSTGRGNAGARRAGHGVRVAGVGSGSAAAAYSDRRLVLERRTYSRRAARVAARSEGDRLYQDATSQPHRTEARYRRCPAARSTVPGRWAWRRRSRRLRRLRRGGDRIRSERRRGQADRRDRESGPPQSRDHRVLLATRRGVRGAGRRGRELVHVRDLGVEAGRADDPRRGPARLLRRRLGEGRWLLHPFATRVAAAAAARPLPARHAPRPADGRAAHAVRRVRAGERRGRAREPEGLRGDRARVRALPRRVPAGRDRAVRPSSSTACGPAIRPTGSATCARRSRATSARAPSTTRRCGRSSPCSRTSRSASTSRRACSPRSARRSTRRRRRRRISAGGRSMRVFPASCGRSSGDRPRLSSASVAARLQRASAAVARELITESLMVLALPGRVLALGANLPDEYPEALRDPADPDLRELLARYEPVAPEPDDCGARDWSELAPADALHRPPLLRVPRAPRAVGAAVHRGAARGASPAASCRKASCDTTAWLSRARPVYSDPRCTRAWQQHSSSRAIWAGPASAAGPVDTLVKAVERSNSATTASMSLVERVKAGGKTVTTLRMNGVERPRAGVASFRYSITPAQPGVGSATI